jgi:ACS family glucarate transporter-like MFS transporter
VTAIFTFSYAVFEIPSGQLGDRIGPRKVLTRIVLWWSVFTSLTGLATGFHTLLVTRFFFGVGEAGAFPNSSIAVARWFPANERGRAFGVVMMATQVGGALAPLLVVPIMVHYGWRAAFYMFGTLGVGWSIVWYRWFRDSPEEMPGISAAELSETSHLIAKADHGLPWKIALRSANLWAVLGVAGCYIYTYNFFQSWFHTYLVKERGFSENDLLLSSVPFLVGGCANLLGGLASNVMVKKLGLEWGRRSIGLFGLGISMLSIAGVLLTHDRFWGMILLSLVYGGITFQQPSVFAVCLDIGGQYAGAVVGAMNTSSQAGAFVSSLAYGYLVARFGSYNVPFLPMLALLLIAAGLWFKVDPNQPLIGARTAEAAA